MVDVNEIVTERTASNAKIKNTENIRPTPTIYNDTIQEIASIDNNDSLIVSILNCLEYSFWVNI